MTNSETIERVGGYRVVRRLATGGTSDVLLAKAEGPLGFERTVVLKILLSEFRSDDDLARMFAREAYAYARLGHPAIVRLFDFFSLPTSRSVGSELPGPPSTRRAPRSADEAQLVMVLEYVDGPSLSRLRSLLKAVGRTMDDHAAIWIASRIFAALAAAHAATDEAGNLAPVIHRDVNPSNVLVPWDGEVKLADFGVAKVMGQAGESVVGMLKGTYGYMAPEQVTGGPISPAADVYAGAIVLWELLARRRAFQRGGKPEVEALRAMIEPDFPSIDKLRPDVDGTVRDALNRALHPKADQRTITAQEMLAVLQRAVPPAEGRDRLVALLGVVRNDARVSTAPLSTTDTSLHAVGARAPGTGEGAPRVPPPAPSSSSKRIVRPSASSRVSTAPYGNPPSRPELPAVAPPGPTTNRGGIGLPTSQTKVSVARPPVPGASQPAQVAAAPAAAAPGASGPPQRPSASHRLAQAMPETVRTPPAPAVGAPLPTVVAPPIASPSPPVAAPARAAAAPAASPAAARPAAVPEPAPSPRASRDVARNLRESIDELLEGPIAPNETGRFKRSDILGPEPPPPSPRRSAPGPVGDLPFQDLPKAPKSFDSSSAPDFGRASSPDVGLGAEPRPPRPAPSERTVAMEARPVARPSGNFEEATKRSPEAAHQTGPMPRQTAPLPSQPGQPAAAGTPSQPAQPVPATPSRSALAAVTAPMPAVPFAAPVAAPSRPPAGTPTTSSAAPPSPREPLATSAPPTPPRATWSPLALGAIGVTAVAAGAIIVAVLRGPGAHAPPAAATARPAPSASSTSASAVAASATASASSTASASTTASASAATAAADAGITSPDAGTAAATDAGAAALVAPAGTASAPAGEGVAGATEGTLKTSGAAPGHRIFVDGVVVGQTPDTVSVKCGARIVRLGSVGKNQSVDVPCGGELAVGDR